MDAFLLGFIPLFVAIDVFGVLPLYVGITEGMDDRSRRRLTTQATLTAFLISVLFLLAGKLLFSFLGITEADFRVGGGVVLLVLAVSDLVSSIDNVRLPSVDAAGSTSTGHETVGVVPIGIPLIMGPAALTTILVLVDTYGYVVTVGSLLANLLLVWAVFTSAGVMTRVMGRAGSRAVSRVAALFLAGIAVMMIRSGIQSMLRM
jgi:multiple antibiotic resistance protein